MDVENADAERGIATRLDAGARARALLTNRESIASVLTCDNVTSC